MKSFFNLTKCKNCGKISKDKAFCPKCGKRIKETITVVVEEGVIFGNKDESTKK